MQVHMSAPNVEQVIDLLISIPADGYNNSLFYVMSEWTKQQGKCPLSLILSSSILAAYLLDLGISF